jgi:DNA-binding transcriptional regulator GbsR (MarR family)
MNHKRKTIKYSKRYRYNIRNSKDFNKLRHKTKEIIKKEIRVTKETVQDMKEELKKVSTKPESNRNPGNKNTLCEIKTTLESHSSILEQDL